MADQAKHFGWSSFKYFSDWRGKSEIPSDFVDRFASWLKLTKEETFEIREFASRKRKRTIVVTPTDDERGVLPNSFLER